MLNWGTAIWQLFNVLVLIALIFGIPYYLFQSFKRQKRIEEKLTEIAEYLKNGRNWNKKKEVLLMVTVGTSSWEILNIVRLIGVIFVVLYYLIQNYKRQMRIENKLNEIAEYLKK